MKLTIKKHGINGEGIAYFKKKPVFVDHALKDEEIEVKTITENNKFIKARIINIIKESNNRREIPCPYFRECGACELLHSEYQNQLDIKKEILKESLNKYAGIEKDFEIIKSPKEFHYRNSLKMPFGYKNNKLVLGFYASNSNHFIEIDNCLLHEEILEETRKKILDVLNKYNLLSYDKKTKKGLRYLSLRTLDNKITMCLMTGEDKIKKEVIDDLKKIENIISISQSINTSRSNEIFGRSIKLLSGNKYLDFKFEDYNLKISNRSFFQLNTKQANNLYHEVIKNINNNDLLVEAYAGIGIMSFLASKKAKKVIAIEEIREAINNGIMNAKENNIDNVEFYLGRSEDILKNKFKKRIIDTLIVDPPRSGLSNEMLNIIMRLKINSIIYVSCNTSTLAKNLNVLLDKYEIKSIKAFDMFSNCSDVECVIKLENKYYKRNINDK